MDINAWLPASIPGFNLDAYLEQFPAPTPQTRVSGARARRNGSSVRPTNVATLVQDTPPAVDYSDCANLPDHDYVICCARRYAETVDLGVQGNNGSGPCFRLACVLVREFNLAKEDAYPILKEYGDRCDPPWADWEIHHKLDDADNFTGLRGEKIPERPRVRLLQPPPITDDVHRATIEITYDRALIVDQAIEVLSQTPDIFQKTSCLFNVIRSQTVESNRHIWRPSGAPWLCRLHPHKLNTILSRVIAWQEWRNNPRTNELELRDTVPPDWVANQVIHENVYPRIPVIEGIMETPFLRPDGSFVTQPGYDKMTGILFEPNMEYLPCISNPTHEDAFNSLLEINDVITDFPFKNRNHKAAFISALLTPFARFAIDGPVPVHIFDASQAGSGKTLLCDIIAMILTGRRMPRSVYPDNAEEMRKRATSIAIAGDPATLFDNVHNGFGDGTLDILLTGVTWTDRLLGTNEMKVFPFHACLYATGNNFFFRGDTWRRAIPCRLIPQIESPHERPEDSYKHGSSSRLLSYILSQRAQLVRACLTILRAYFVAGCPRQSCPPLGSFEAWSDLVRSAILWLCEEDVVQTQREFAAEDKGRELQEMLLNGWIEIQTVHGGPLSVAEAYTRMEMSAQSQYYTLKYVRDSIRNDGRVPSLTQFGYKLRDVKDRIINGKRMVRTTDPIRGSCWFVEVMGGSSAVADSAELFPE